MTNRALKVAVVTGGHAFDTQGFHHFFRGLRNIDTYIQHLDEFASIPASIGLTEGNDFHPGKARRSYDVIVFYCMVEGAPKDEDIPWYQGAPKTALDELQQSSQGIFVLHHALLHYPESPEWDRIVGIERRNLKSWHFGQTLEVQVANRCHPITEGLDAFTCTDESYVLPEPGNDSDILLTVDHPNSMHRLAWTRQYGESRVFCLQLGHDKLVWTNPNFQALIERGIRWCAP